MGIRYWFFVFCQFFGAFSGAVRSGRTRRQQWCSFPLNFMGIFVSSAETKAAEQKAAAARDLNIAANQKAAAEDAKAANDLRKETADLNKKK
jgi:hypothetical protein